MRAFYQLIIYSSHVLGCMFSGMARISGSPNWVEAKGIYPAEMDGALACAWRDKESPQIIIRIVPEYVAGERDGSARCTTSCAPSCAAS